MTDKELRRLKRRDQIELLVRQQEEIDRLTQELETANKKLIDRDLKLREAGSIAEASLQLSGIFQAAQEAADLYLENVKKASVREIHDNYLALEQTEQASEH